MTLLPDLLELRARELAMIAGLNPDHDQPVGAPAWFAFRQAAAAESAALSYETNLLTFRTETV